MDIGIVSQNTSERNSFFDRLRGDDAVGETITFKLMIFHTNPKPVCNGIRLRYLI